MAKLKAVAFDMDDTLLSINIGAFIAMFIMDEAHLLAQAGSRHTFSMFTSFASSLIALNADGRPMHDTRTNLEFFAQDIERRSGVPFAEPAVIDMLTYYEREILPRKNDRLVSARPRTGAHEAVEAVLDRGLRVALLTNPCFSRACIECRMGWGKLTDMPFELVTTWENSTRCKPNADYYRSSLASLGLAPDEVLMVGNDPKRDLPVPDIGLQTAYVGSGEPKRALWCGSMADFARSLPKIEERFLAHADDIDRPVD